MKRNWGEIKNKHLEAHWDIQPLWLFQVAQLNKSDLSLGKTAAVGIGLEKSRYSKVLKEVGTVNGGFFYARIHFFISEIKI